MGRQVGLIKVSGNIGGVSFYKSNGESLARVANGPSKEKIQNDASFVRTRENNSEFGGAATIAKALRLSLATSVQTMGDNRIVSRLTALFKNICNRSTGIRGQRPFTVSANAVVLENLEFNNKQSFGSVFNAPYTAVPSPQRDMTTVTVPAFLPQSFIKAPAGATHFRLISAIGVLSDYKFNTSTNHYEPTDPTLNLLGGVDYSPVTPVNSAAPVPFILKANLPGGLAMTSTANLIQCIGIEFYQQVDGLDYLLAQGNAMKLTNVF